MYVEHFSEERELFFFFFPSSSLFVFFFFFFFCIVTCYWGLVVPAKRVVQGKYKK